VVSAAANEIARGAASSRCNTSTIIAASCAQVRDRAGGETPLERGSVATETPQARQSERRRRVGWAAGLAAAYLALSLVAVWPLPARLGSVLSQGTDRAATVPLFQAWSMWWVSDRLASDVSGLWHAPIFHPTPSTFVFSDPMLLVGVIGAPVFWAGGSPALAYNLFLLLALVTNGLFGYGLLCSAGLRRPAAAVGGAMLVMLPYVHHELGVLMLLPLAGLIGALWAWLAFAKHPSWRSALGLGVGSAATYLLCGQYGIFIGLVLAPAGLWMLRRELFRARALLALLGGAAVAALLIAPLVAIQLGALGDHDFQRSESAALMSASHPSAWLATPWPQLVPVRGVEAVDEAWKQAHFPGTLKLLLALIGVSWGLSRAETRRWAALLLTATLLASLFSALPRLEIGDFSLHRVLRDRVPGLAQMRSYWRFIVVAQIGLVLLAAMGIQALIQIGTDRLPRRSRRGIVAAATALGLLAAIELWPRGQTLHPVPDLEQWRPWTGWLSDNVAADEAVVHLPFPAGVDARHWETTAGWMYLMSAHGRAMGNGYSGFFPESYRRLSRALHGCPQPAGYELIRSMGHRILVIESSWLEANTGCAPPGRDWQREVSFDALDVEIWRSTAEAARRDG
jgi:hypothetical protein